MTAAVEAAAEAAAAPALGLAAQVQVKREPRAAAEEEQQGAAAPAVVEHSEQLPQDEHEANGGPATQQQQQQQGQPAVLARLLAGPKGAVEVGVEEPPDMHGNAGLAANGHQPALLLPAAVHAEALAGGGSRVGSQPSEDIEAQAVLALPGTQQSACCPAEEAALLCMLPAQQQRQRPPDGGRPLLLAQLAAPPALQQDVQQPEPQNGTAAPHAAADADATPAASTGSPTLTPEMERVYTQAAQQVLQNLPAAFEKADTSCSASMLRPLGRLLLAGQGGHTLRVRGAPGMHCVCGGLCKSQPFSAACGASCRVSIRGAFDD